MTHRRLIVLAIVVPALLAACGSSPSPSASGATAVSHPPAGSAVTSAGASPAGTSPEASAAPGTSATAAAPTASPAPAATPSPTHVPRFALSSGAFARSGPIPAKFTCHGADVSPSLQWAGTPAGTVWLVLLMDDPDAGHFAHWIAYAISAATVRLDENAGSPASSRLAQGTNDFGRIGYGGPCPPSGTHHYVFTLYALAAPLGLSGAPHAAAVRAALEKAHILGKATLTGTFTR